MTTKSISYVREESPTAQRHERSDAPVEIKIPQRIVNLPVMPTKKLLGKIVALVLSMIALVAGGVYFSF